MASEARRLDWRVVLEAVRLTRGYTRAEHARRAGLTGPGLAKILRPEANPTLLSIERLAGALGCWARVVIEPLPDMPVSPADLTQHPAWRAGVEAGIEKSAKVCEAREKANNDEAALDGWSRADRADFKSCAKEASFCARDVRALLDTKEVRDA